MSRFARLAFTDTVRQLQQDEGTRPAHWKDLGEAVGRERDPLGERETDFITGRDGFYLASVGETGWPYIQFRGGPPGFVHVLDPLTLACADVRGNRQYITNGNLKTDSRVALFFMDYAHQSRLKLLGRAHTRDLDEDRDLVERVSSSRTAGRVERVMVIDLEGYDWNCPKHIPRRFSDAELAPTYERLHALEKENAILRERLAELGADTDPPV
ncbi:pyridoxamine 5'-phosphate oxidase family protein [Nocardiopsis rhodophaea]|uniref:pyridoxamine 5'-phosphate oxidase family protein n=1 Tax=Nocardiopsis rhodophaea TaxID=280238 RepID=UPI0031DBCF57